MKYLFPGNFKNKSVLLHQSQHGKKKTRKAAIVLFSENPKNQAISCQIIFFFFPSFYITSGIGLALYVHVLKVVTRIALVQEAGRIVLEEDSVILGQTSKQNTKAASLIPQFLPSLP